MRINVEVNGKPCVWKVNPGAILLDVLRDEGYTSVKHGCGEGYCGACMVLVDGVRRNACLMLAGQVHERKITTSEGLGSVHLPHPIQKAFVEAGAVQCGFCTPALVLSVKELLEQSPDPTDEEIKTALDGNMCRCTGYVKIVDAVKRAAELCRDMPRDPALPVRRRQP